MPSIVADKLAFAHVEQAPIFQQSSFRLEAGFTGVVGANGSGKTTLARLISREFAPISGALRLEPADARVVICEQRVEALTTGVREFAEDADGAAMRLRGRLKLDSRMLMRWSQLSPGERKRWQLASALAASPDVLILDEPTNHLDAPARERLLNALHAYRGIGLLISHDRDWLDSLTHQTLRLHQGDAKLYPGAYSAARELWQDELRRTHAERAQRLEERDRVAARLSSTRVKAASAERNRSTRQRQRQPGDPEARAIGAKNLAAWAEARLSRSVGKLRDDLERKEQQIPDFVPDKTLGGSVFADYQAPKKRDLSNISQLDLYAGARCLARRVSLALKRHDRVWLSGNNGAGKTTLLNALYAASDPTTTFYVRQELGAEQIAELARTVQALPATERGRLFSVVAALGVDPERLRSSEQWSPGEARKVKIALGFATHAAALLLDEPTNHLDLPSVERLEAALRAYPGALVVVSHDARFVQSMAETRWELHEGELRVSALPRPFATP